MASFAILRRTSALSRDDTGPLDFIPWLCAKLLPIDVLVPVMHELLFDLHSTKRLERNVREALERFDLPLPDR